VDTQQDEKLLILRAITSGAAWRARAYQAAGITQFTYIQELRKMIYKEARTFTAFNDMDDITLMRYINNAIDLEF
jgi:hypothetical protein